MSGRLARCNGGTGRLSRRPFYLDRGVLHLLHVADLTATQARKPGGELGRRRGQLFDDGLHLVAQRIRAQNERTHHARHHDDSADNARNPDRFEPSDERIQRVGNDDAKQQRHYKGLRPRQGEDRREHRQHA
jgi:hypothetical protein